jgi:hypothetical protein
VADSAVRRGAADRPASRSSSRANPQRQALVALRAALVLAPESVAPAEMYLGFAPALTARLEVATGAARAAPVASLLGGDPPVAACRWSARRSRNLVRGLGASDAIELGKPVGRPPQARAGAADPRRAPVARRARSQLTALGAPPPHRRRAYLRRPPRARPPTRGGSGGRRAPAARRRGARPWIGAFGARRASGTSARAPRTSSRVSNVHETELLRDSRTAAPARPSRSAPPSRRLHRDPDQLDPCEARVARPDAPARASSETTPGMFGRSHQSSRWHSTGLTLGQRRPRLRDAAPRRSPPPRRGTSADSPIARDARHAGRRCPRRAARGSSGP